MAKVMKSELRQAHFLYYSLKTIIYSAVGQNISFAVGEDQVLVCPFRRSSFHDKLLLLLILKETDYSKRQRKSSAFPILRRRKVVFTSLLLLLSKLLLILVNVFAQFIIILI